MSDELKPCPFCGAPGVVEYLPSWRPEYPYVPMCSKCPVRFGGCETERKAARIWNKRVAATPEPDAETQEDTHA